MRSTSLRLLVAFLVATPLASQTGYVSEIEGADSRLYKEVGGHELLLHLIRPANTEPPVPGIVFFYGGGWRQGTPLQFLPHAHYLAERGMLVALADYRVQSRHGTTPVQAVEDAKSAIRWLRRHAEEIGLDPGRLAAGGGSAGGHLAVSAALIAAVNDPGDDLSISAVPDALVLFNPALDLSGLATSRWAFDGDPLSISPQQHVHAGMPPAVLFHGSEDRTVPFRHAVAFTEAVRAAGNEIELVSFEGRGHGFFNRNRGSGEDYEATVAAMDRFLTEQGFLPPPRTGVEVTFLANEGVLLRCGDRSVVIDGFLRQPYSIYGALPQELHDAMTDGASPFSHVDLALASHVHRDHFQPEMAGDFLRRHPETELVSSPQVVGSLAALTETARQVREVWPEPGEVLDMERVGIAFGLFRLRHANRSNYEVQNLGHLIEMCGLRLLHVGDAEGLPQQFEELGLAERRIDVAFVPYWYLLSSGWPRQEEAIGAERYVAVHLPPAEAEELAGRLARTHPEILPFTAPGSRHDF